MKILDVNIKTILDSRGQETLSADLRGSNADLRGQASVPSGKSRGVHEAFVLEPKKALEKFQEIKPRILSHDFETQEEFDNFLISLDGTQNKPPHQTRISAAGAKKNQSSLWCGGKQNLGANLILALSLAFARLKAKNEKKELFEYIRSIAQLPITNYQLPRPIFNVINGGAHSGYPRKSALNQHQSASLDFQEFQIIPEVKDFGMAYGLGKEFYEKLKEFLENKFGKENVVLGDEAGFSCPFKNNEEAIEILAELIAKYNYPLRIGLDVAATQFFKGQGTRDKGQGTYLIDNKEYSAEELKNFYLKLIKAYNILSIEDPFYEEDFGSFALLTTELRGLHADQRGKFLRQSASSQLESVLVITDDLTTTNPERLKIAINKKAGNTILIKLNQIGTLTETLNVIQLAYENGWQVIVSHRSGETMDDFIGDLAVGVNAWGLKAGAPAAPERLAKYERILEINFKFQTPNYKQITNSNI